MEDDAAVGPGEFAPAADRLPAGQAPAEPESGTGESGTGDGRRPPGRRGRWRSGSWRAVLFAPVGDGQTRRRGSDAVRVGLALIVILVCWLATRVNPSSEKALVNVVTPVPDGLNWLVTSIGWIGSFGLVAAIVVLALVSRRTAVIRDAVIAGAGAWLLCVVLSAVFGADGGRPPGGAPHGYDLAFPVARVAATVAVASAALPYLSRWLQRTIQVTVVLLAISTVVSGRGLPVAVLASLAIGVLATAVVHLVFGSPLGLPSADEVTLLLGDLGIVATDLAPAVDQEWGVGKFTGNLDGHPVDVSVYGRDASDAQLLAKTTRFLLYRDSGPTLTFTRRQQVEHEAYLTLMADRAGARVSRVLAAGPAGPAKDALLVTRPPPGRRLAQLVPYAMPPEPETAGTSADGAPMAGGTRALGSETETETDTETDTVTETEVIVGAATVAGISATAAVARGAALSAASAAGFASFFGADFFLISSAITIIQMIR